MKLPPSNLKTDFLPFVGGLDVVTPPLSVPQGYCRAAQNFEIDINGGYARILGYERFNGKPSPSDARYAVLNTTLTAPVAVGALVTDESGAAVGRVIAIEPKRLVLAKVAGTFATGDLKIGTTKIGTCIGPQIVDGAGSASLGAEYQFQAANAVRTDISSVPGSGAILGVHIYSDVLYAWRNNAGGTAAGMYRASSTGWQAVPLGREIAFTSGGATEVVVGDTIIGATSGATAILTRVILDSGSWLAGDAIGRFIFASQTGNFASENINVGGVNLATVAGNSSAIAFSIPGGRFTCVNENFGGGASTKRMYGTDGKNRGFEFDGATLVPINTGMNPDAPEHCIAHRSHLFFSFDGSVQHSSPGQPYNWNPILGAAELGMGDRVTGFASQPGSEAGAALTIFTRNKISTLYGTSVSDWNLVDFKDEAGALPFSIQRIGNTVMMDDRGVTSLATAQTFGNFSDATISQRIQTFLIDKRIKITDSCVARNKNQYRLFFSDRYALFATIMNKKLLGFMPVLFQHAVRCVASGELLDGTEAIYFGSDDGMVYQMERGASFDGAEIDASFSLAFASLKSPRINKHFKRGIFEVTGDGYAEFEFSYELGYGLADVAQPDSTNMTTNFSAPMWDSFTWDSFFWDGKTLSPSVCDMTGSGENISIKIRSKSSYFAPIRFGGALIDYTPRMKLR